MSVAYIDTSALAAVIFNEPDAPWVVEQLAGCEHLLASNLLEAEIRAACAREQVVFELSAVSSVKWVLPDRPLTPEIVAVLRAGHLRGADLWHVASALYVSPQADRLAFATLDRQQATVAHALGFSVLQGP